MTARLRANGLVPAAIPVRIAVIRPGSRSGGWKWRAEHAVSGAYLGTGSRHPVSDLGRYPDWTFTREDLGTHIGIRGRE